MNRVVHFEMPAKDSAPVSTFYSGVFGWQMQNMGEHMGNYILATATPSDEAGQPTSPGGINGGFFPVEEGSTETPSFVIEVDDINAHMQKVKDAGGQVEGEPSMIPGIGLFVVIIDTEGNRASMLQPVAMS